MLLLSDRYEVVHNFVLVDAHTHLRTGEREGLVPFEFIRRSAKMVRDVAFDIAKNPREYRFGFPWEMKDEGPDYHQFCQRDVYSTFHPGEDLVGGQERFCGLDFIITFPSNLKTRLPRDYRAVNSKIREALIEKSTDNEPHNNFRFIGFGRVDPNHSDALDAFDNVHQLGLRGLKLHPKEEGFDIGGERTVNLLYRAAHHNLPVIFHTQEGSAARVETAVNAAIRNLIGHGKTDLLPRLKVILGHAPWNGTGDPDLFRILSHPNIFGELSTLRAESCSEFFSNSKAMIRYDGIFDVESLAGLDRSLMERLYFAAFGYNIRNYWSSKLMFGSDTPYPPSHGASPLLKHLFSNDFAGSASDIQNILGASALRLVPPISSQGRGGGAKRASSKRGFHAKQLEALMGDSRALGVTPLIENFPVVRVSGAVFSFLSDGEITDYLFKCLFETKNPLSMILPNPYDLATSSQASSELSLPQRIESCLGGN